MADEDLRGAFRALHASALACAEALGRPRPAAAPVTAWSWLLAAPALVAVAGLAGLVEAITHR